MDEINKTFIGGKALAEYDPVAYFTDGKPIKGLGTFQTEWRGANWLFASAGHRDLFKADPERYAPQYGGYCAKAVSEGKIAGISPEAWKIVDGKLYLNYNMRIQKAWEVNYQERIKQADTQWPLLVGGKAGKP